MALELNDTIEPYRDFRSDDAKTYLAQMPLVIADGRVPLSVANLMERRLHAGKSAVAWKDNYFDVDGIAYNAGGSKFKIILDSQDLRKVTPKTDLKNVALMLGDGVYEQLQGQEFIRSDYEQLQGQEFIRSDLKNLLERDLSADEVKAHPVWKALVRDDALLTEYTDTMFAEMKTRFKYDTAMGLYLASGEKVPSLRAGCVYRLEVRSQFNGWNHLDCDYGRLVGVAPEALNAPGWAIVRPSLETAIGVVNQYLGQSNFELRTK